MARTYNSNRYFGGDLLNIIMLTTLYCIQGVPLGLTQGSLPYILKKHLSYTDLAIVSISGYPFSLKFFWSPLVDSKYVEKWGRRKTWIVPLQFASSCLMIYLSTKIDDMIQDGTCIYQLAFVCFCLTFLYATQDIAIDAWALEVLSDENRHLASSCQSIGQLIGFFLSFTVFLTLNSVEFCNMYIYDSPQDKGVLGFSEYLQFWGIFAFIVNLIIAVFKKEDVTQEEDIVTFKGILQKLVELAKNPYYQKVIIVITTSRLAFSANDNVLPYVFMEKGLQETSLAALALFQVPIEITISLSVAYLNKKFSPLSLYLFGIQLRLFVCFAGIILLLNFPEQGPDETFFTLLILNSILLSVGSNIMFTSIFAFIMTIADTSFGGTFVTMLATLINLGGSVPRFFVLTAVDILKQPDYCIESELPCSEDCQCVQGMHGFYPVSAILLTFGIFYFFFQKRWINELISETRKKEENKIAQQQLNMNRLPSFGQRKFQSNQQEQQESLMIYESVLRQNIKKKKTSQIILQDNEQLAVVIKDSAGVLKQFGITVKGTSYLLPEEIIFLRDR